MTPADSESTFSLIKETVGSIIDKYGKDKVRYAVIGFGTNARIFLNFGEQSDDLDTLKEYIKTLQQPQGDPDLQAALLQADRVFKRARPNAKKVLVVVLNKKSVSR